MSQSNIKWTYQAATVKYSDESGTYRASITYGNFYEVYDCETMEILTSGQAESFIKAQILAEESLGIKRTNKVSSSIKNFLRSFLKQNKKSTT